MIYTQLLSFVLLFLTLFVPTFGALHDPPKAVISEYYGNPYYENLRSLRVPRNSEIIVGETTSKGITRLLFECSAEYPVQWIYAGDGIPEISTDTNVKRGQSNSLTGDFGASLSIAKLTESHTGNYTCKGTMNRNEFVSFHLYVPGPKIFTANGGENITFTNQDTLVRIPCSVSHPNARVTLQKSRNGFVTCPLNDSLRYNPKIGFVVRVKELREPAGQYVCTASHEKMYRVVEFDLVEKYEPVRFSACNPNPCGRNAECLLSSGRVVCTCLNGYDGDPFTECRNSIQRTSDPCNPSPCGRYGDCVVRNGLAACTCPQGFRGKPPHCTNVKHTSRCVINQDCDSTEVCMERQCTSPCGPNRCGRHAECQVVNRTPICSCPPGYVGDPNHECVPDYKAPYEDQEERLRPECQYDEECPTFLACIHQKCQSPCPSMCGPYNTECQVIRHKAICNQLTINCPPGDLNCHRLGTPGGCHRAFCGQNSGCSDVNGQGVCSCLPGHTGSPPNCTPMCFGNSGCPNNQACQARKCEDPCIGYTCGINGRCLVKNHKAECQCLNGYVGDPKTRCTLVPSTLLQPLCTLKCGRGARCQFINRTATCKCIDPFDSKCGQMEGDQSCFNDNDCSPLQGCFNSRCKNPCTVFRNLCGENQECVVTQHKAECTCRPGFPIRVNNDCFRDVASERSDDFRDGEDNDCESPFCRRGDARTERNRCRFNGDCSSSRMCVNSQCIDPCVGSCGLNAECVLDRNRVPKCMCPAGYLGSPRIQCHPLFRHVKDGAEGGGKDIIALNGNGTTNSPVVEENDAKKLVEQFMKKNNSSSTITKTP